MKSDFLLAGFGGQGVLTMGLFITYAGLTEGRKVSYVPAYGAEMRGGTANCTVNISDREISSPVVAFPENVVVMNHPSLEKFESSVRTGGLLLINRSLVHRDALRTDIEAHSIPAQEMADELGFHHGSNMIMLGILLELTQVIDTRNIETYLMKTFKGKYLDKMPINEKTIRYGMEFARKLSRPVLPGASIVA